MPAGYLIDFGSCVDLASARRAGAEVAVEQLWDLVPGGRDRFDVEGFLALRNRVATELAGRNPGGTTLATVSRLLEDAGIVDEALALAVDAIYRDVRDRHVVALEGATETLARLLERHRVGLVAVGLIDWRFLAVEVDTVLVPRALGLVRGDAELVTRAAGRLGVAVGDLEVVAPTGSPLLAAAEQAGAVPHPTGPAGIAGLG